MSLHSAVVIMEVHFLKYHKRLKRGENGLVSNANAKQQ